MSVNVENIKKNQSFSLPIWLLKRLKMASAERDESQSDILTRALCRELGVPLSSKENEDGDYYLVPKSSVSPPSIEDEEANDPLRGATHDERELEEHILKYLSQTTLDRRTAIHAQWHTIQLYFPDATLEEWYIPLEERLRERERLERERLNAPLEEDVDLAPAAQVES